MMTQRDLHIVPTPPEPEPLSPDLEKALTMYQELKIRCNFDLGTVCRLQSGQLVDPADLLGKDSIATDDLLTKYPKQLTSEQRHAIEVGIPKVYRAFEQAGFPDLDFRETTGGIASFTGFATVYFLEFATPGRNFGKGISLLHGSEDVIADTLNSKLDNSVLDIGAKARRAAMRSIVSEVVEIAAVDERLAIEEERDRLRRAMRANVIVNPPDTESPSL